MIFKLGAMPYDMVDGSMTAFGEQVVPRIRHVSRPRCLRQLPGRRTGATPRLGPFHSSRLRLGTSSLTFSISALTISATNSLKLTVCLQPSFSRAFEGSLTR